MVQMAKLQDERELICLVSNVWGVSFYCPNSSRFQEYQSEFCQKTHHPRWFKRRDFNEGNLFRGVGRVREETWEAASCFIPGTEGAKKGKELSEPWPLVPRRRSCPAGTPLVRRHNCYQKKRESWEKNILNYLFACAAFSWEGIPIGQTQSECSLQGAQLMWCTGPRLQGHKAAKQFS